MTYEGNDFYYALKPVHNPIFILLNQLKNYQVNLRDIESEIERRNIELVPKAMKTLKVIIEYSDCIIQAKNMVEYSMIIDDNKKRMQS